MQAPIRKAEYRARQSLTGRTLLGLLPPEARWSATSLRFDGRDLLAMTAKERRRLCGTQMSMILQDPKCSLNPVMTVAQQMRETFARQGERLGRKAMCARIVEALAAVHIRDPERVADAYPHELSGGMSQCVMIAMMVFAGPRLLIDTSTSSAPDVLVSMQVLSVLDEMIARHDTATSRRPRSMSRCGWKSSICCGACTPSAN